MMEQINPFTEEVLASHAFLSDADIRDQMEVSRTAYHLWRNRKPEHRLETLFRLAGVLEKNKPALAEAMAEEMGKPLSEGLAEVEKSAFTLRYFAREAGKWLEDQVFTLDDKTHRIRLVSQGAVCLIMPWNFPLWQVIRAGIGALCIGNVWILKHAPQVFRFADRLESLFQEAGFPDGVLVNLKIGVHQFEPILADPHVCGLALTGSEAAGRAAAALAGKHLKRCVLELGGNDAFLVLPDADLEACIESAVQGRMINNGQSCIAAKRFLVHRKIHDDFVKGLQSRLRDWKMGDPRDPTVQLGPLARQDLREKLLDQIQASVRQGARLWKPDGGLPGSGYFVAPHLLLDARPGMVCFEEELFGPVFTLVAFDTDEEALQLANASRFGLGATVHSRDKDRARKLAEQLEAGTVVVNGLVRSQAALPFGGTKVSGFGRELSSRCLEEFANVQVLTI